MLPVCAAIALAAVEPTVVLGPDIDVSAGFARPDLSQYQADLRCDPGDARRMLITCKVADGPDVFERRTMVYRTVDGGVGWTHVIEPDSGDPDCVFAGDGSAHRSFIWNAHRRHAGYRRSRDGGATWEPAQELPPVVDHLHIACDRGSGAFAGSLYIAGRNFTGDGVTVARSRDGGASWQTAAITMPAPLGKGFVYGPAVTASGALVIPYTGGPVILSRQVAGVATYDGKRQEVHVLRSADGGVTFTRIRVGDTDAAVGAGYPTAPNLAQIAVGRLGGGQRLYLAWPHAQRGAVSQLLLATSDDDGATWTPPRAVVDRAFPDGFSPSSCSAMADRDGVLGLQWIAIDAGGTAFHLCFAASTDGGATFSAPVQVTPVPSLVPGGRLPMPELKPGMRLPGQPRSPGQDQLYGDVGPDGVFHLVWTDARAGDPLGNLPGYAIHTRTATVHPSGP